VYLPMTALRLSITRSYYQPYRRSIFFWSGFPPSNLGCSLLVRVRHIRDTTLSICYGRPLQSERYFRLIASIDNYVRHISGVGQKLVSNSKNTGVGYLMESL
jgi:hypothetical protein